MHSGSARARQKRNIVHKLELGLTTSAAPSSRNLGLSLSLLGLKVPDGALIGLYGALIGLRTVNYRKNTCSNCCRLSPVSAIEDLHWIDGASEEFLGKIVDSETKLRLLLLTTRRPGSAALARSRSAVVSRLPLEPLPLGDIRRLKSARLGVEGLPQLLEWQIAEKVDGKLFAEEVLVSFLSERGMVRTTTGQMLASMPRRWRPRYRAKPPAPLASHRLSRNDRVLLQAASVIGRRFDEESWAVGVVGEIDVNVWLMADEDN